MAVDNPFEITWAGFAVGGTSDAYQLSGPYVISMSFNQFLLVFDVAVVATSYSDLYTKCDDIESAFRTRLTGDETLVIDMDGSTWTYTYGQTIFNAEPSITKTGSADTDFGFTRTYTIRIAGELPDESGGGVLPRLSVNVRFEPSRQRSVTMSGTYYADASTSAVAKYLAGFDAVATSYLNFVDSGATWELIDESYTIDKEEDNGGLPRPHTCSFTRQYLELIYDQKQGTLDASEIRDHTISFTDVDLFEPVGSEEAEPMQRVAASFECSVDKDQTQDIRGLWTDTLKPYVLSTFESEFSPSVFAVEDVQLRRDETSNRMAAIVQIIYQRSGASNILSVTQSVTLSEQRQVNYTPVHGEDELAYEVDVGWLMMLRQWDRRVVVIGEETPKKRLTEKPVSGEAGLFEEIGGEEAVDGKDATTIKLEGWNVLSSESRIDPQWVGDVNDDPIRLTILTETVVERFTRKPQGTNGFSSGAGF